MAQWGKCLQYVNQTLAPVVKKKKTGLTDHVSYLFPVLGDRGRRIARTL